MAKYEKNITGNFHHILNTLHNSVMQGSLSASFEGASDYSCGDFRCAVRVYERYSWLGSNRVSLALTLAGIVMYDAMGVRRAAGEQAKVLNRMIFNFKLFGEDFWKEFNLDQELSDQEADEGEPKELKEFLGHTPLEVLGGALLGILVAVLVPVF